MARCERRRYVGNLYVQIRCGTATSVQCDVWPRSNTWHIVKLRNLWPYPARFTCTGTIDPPDRPPRVRFEPRYPPNPNIGPTHWLLSDTISSNATFHDIDHVAIRGTLSGDEQISTTIKAHWDDPIVSEEDTLVMIVTACP
jgi:hypothetical protein